MSMEILIGKGVGSIQFGQVEAEVVQQLGQPDKVYAAEDAKCLQYFDLQVELWFEHERDDRFGWAVVKNPDATLFGQKLMGENAEKVLAVVAAVIADAPEHEDYGSFEAYLYKNYWLELQFEFGRLRSINIGVLWLDDDTVAWP